MLLNEIMQKCKQLEVDEERCVTDEYVELVIFNTQIDDWHTVMTEAMGSPVSPYGTEPTTEDLKITENYGGLWRNQVLYKKVLSDVIMIAMFWPWTDDKHTTLRMARIGKDKI